MSDKRHVKSPFPPPDFNQTRAVSMTFSKTSEYKNCIKTLLIILRFLHTGGRTRGHTMKLLAKSGRSQEPEALTSAHSVLTQSIYFCIFLKSFPATLWLHNSCLLNQCTLYLASPFFRPPPPPSIYSANSPQLGNILQPAQHVEPSML
jgi:hypothetical protein